MAFAETTGDPGVLTDVPEVRLVTEVRVTHPPPVPTRHVLSTGRTVLVNNVRRTTTEGPRVDTGTRSHVSVTG